MRYYYRYIKLRNDDENEAIIGELMSLIVSIARRFLGLGFTFEELVHEGVIGALIAIQPEHYDSDKGELGQYAANWILHSIASAITEKSHLIRIPDGLRGKLIQFARIKNRLFCELGRQPTSDEIAEHTNFDITEINRMEELMMTKTITTDEHEVFRITRQQTQLDHLDDLVEKVLDISPEAIGIKYGLPISETKKTTRRTGKKKGFLDVED